MGNETELRAFLVKKPAREVIHLFAQIIHRKVGRSCAEKSLTKEARELSKRRGDLMQNRENELGIRSVGQVIARCQRDAARE
jgi:hypothetical protein